MISKSNQPTTAAQLLAMRDDQNRYELVNGVLIVMSPAGSEHGRIAARILARLVIYVEENGLGETYTSETGFRIGSSPDTVRAPDAAFVSRDKLDSVEPTRGYLPLAPDLVVEVVSPSDVFEEVQAKAHHWLRAGSKVVLVADPINLTLQVYKSAHEMQVLRSGDVFSAGDVCGDWKLTVDDVFKIERE